MGRREVIIGALLCAAVGQPSAWAQAGDPRTAEGQLQVCGGAANWQKVAYLEFEVRIETAQDILGPWLYRWARRDGFVRLTGRTPDGSQVDLAVELASRTGGGWKNGAQLSGQPLAETVAWALSRFTEDVLWLTFPLEWGAPGVALRPLPDTLGEDGVAFPAVEVRSAQGTWSCVLNRETGRIARTTFSRPGAGSYTAIWDDWQEHAGVFFAGRRSIIETGEIVFLIVKQVLPEVPPTAF